MNKHKKKKKKQKQRYKDKVFSVSLVQIIVKKLQHSNQPSGHVGIISISEQVAWELVCVVCFDQVDSKHAWSWADNKL